MKPNMVSYRREELPPLSEEARQRLKRLANLTESEIDYSDIPGTTPEQWKNAVRGRFYRPLKKQITAKVDADILHWLKSGGRGYQSRMNAILRREMLAALAKSKAA